jgi:TRAP transporter TAXI family solute receptor
MKKILSSIISLSLFFAFGQQGFSASNQNIISIGTGAITGVYYPAGGAICRLFNRLSRSNLSEGKSGAGDLIRCSTESTGGSISNLNGIRNGALDFGIVQSDWQYNAMNGIGMFSDQKPFKELRSVFSLHTETFVIAVQEKSNIKTIDDIAKKRVNFGPVGSGFYATMEILMKVKGWTKDSFSEVTYIEPSQQPKNLCDGNIDVMIYSAGNPNGVIQEATQLCKVRLISIDAETIKELTKSNPYYVKATIPGGMYSGNPTEIETFGVKASLVTSDKISDEIAYNITKVVFENFDNFQTLHPVFSLLNKKDMALEGNSAPIHPGAKKYFCEAKLMKCN